MPNTYQTSSGDRVSKKVIDRKIREAKEEKIWEMINEHGYVFCEDCGRNSNCGRPIDCSHDISVKECQESGRTELAWDVGNITMRCRVCHRKHDKTY